MQIFKGLLRLLIFTCPLASAAQSTYLNEGSKDIHFVERMEIKLQRNNDLNFSALRPFNRQVLVRQLEGADSLLKATSDSSGQSGIGLRNRFTAVDEYNLRSFLMNNREWVTVPGEDFKSRRPILNTFYQSKANLVEVTGKDFFLAVNPVLRLQFGKEDNNEETQFVNSAGITLRGRVANKIGFSGYITNTRERGPSFFQEQVNAARAVHGQGYYRSYKGTAYDYLDARGYLTLGVLKDVNLQFGYDKNFIGSGYRSLFLSDWSSSYLFLKLNAKVWKLNYQTIFMKLRPQFLDTGDTLSGKKYAAIHHLSLNVTKWLNVGGFEAVAFGRQDHFDFEYLNPAIFYRGVEGNLGSPDNAFVGLDFKANIAKRAQLYGQFLLDEFVFQRIKNDPTYWANKYGIQLGAKYVDAFGIKNLDLQGEINYVRPFTYSHGDTIANYTHYNQPLAHPLGANFREFIGILDYQPLPRLRIYSRAIYYVKGLDIGGTNYGGDPFENYRNRTMEFGFKVGSGIRASTFNFLFRTSYELKQNLFLDLSGLSRTFKVAGAEDKKTTTINAGLRWNIFSREYDY